MNTDSFIRKAVVLKPHGINALDASLNCGHYARLNVSAEFVDAKFMRHYSSGYLSDNWFDEWRAAAPGVDINGRSAGSVFTIFSYRTPIAWYDEWRKQWVIPNVFYSPTTAKHQIAVRRAVGYEYRDEPLVPANYRDNLGHVMDTDGIVRDNTGRII